MQKNIIFILVFCFIFNLCNADANCVLSVAKKEIGVREATGKNDGVRVEMYLKSVKSVKGNSWCAGFVNWCLEQCNVKTCKSAWSPSWFPSSRLTSGFIGDVFGIYFPSKKRIAHVGFIYKIEKDYYITIEGNTNEAGSREGDGVYMKRRAKRSIYRTARWD